ncbi:hypothetical protein [Brevundimonas sp.]|uniref:hypothetical protein n=1 Tax=Brevundimonas sp. TaxID=1871086 RepID=UPI002D584DFB|nr:hypothetical protein [Brevundimonas sp.]HYC99130.1 hypothetical protein [Brevundimonas sp.]
MTGDVPTAQPTRVLLVALGAAWVVTLAGLVWMMNLAGMRPHHALLFPIYMDLVLKACVVLSVVSAAIGIISVRAGARPRALIGVGGAFGWGVMGALYGAANARLMLINMNPPIPFAIYAPGYAEALVVLLVGLTGTLLGLALLSVRSPRRI